MDDWTRAAWVRALTLKWSAQDLVPTPESFRGDRIPSLFDVGRQALTPNLSAGRSRWRTSDCSMLEDMSIKERTPSALRFTGTVCLPELVRVPDRFHYSAGHSRAPALEL